LQRSVWLACAGRMTGRFTWNCRGFAGAGQARRGDAAPAETPRPVTAYNKSPDAPPDGGGWRVRRVG